MYFKHRLGNLYYEQAGNYKQVIIILPGWGDTRSTFQSIVDHFKKNYTIYIFDYPGFGNSPPIHQALTMDDYATLIKDFLIEKKIKEPILISHSFGGRITAILCGRYQIKTQKIVLMDVAGIKRIKPILFLKTFLYKILKKLCLFVHQDALLNKIRCLFSSSDYQNIPPFMTQAFQNIIQEDLKRDYQAIHSSVLLLWGEKDNDTPLKDAYFLQKHIQKSELIVYPDVGHFCYLERPYLTQRILEEFFKEKDMD